VTHPIEKVWAESSAVVINRKLTAQEVQRLAAAGAGPGCVVDLYANDDVLPYSASIAA
jgi:hypothetical protein